MRDELTHALEEANAEHQQELSTLTSQHQAELEEMETLLSAEKEDLIHQHAAESKRKSAEHQRELEELQAKWHEGEEAAEQLQDALQESHEALQLAEQRRQEQEQKLEAAAAELAALQQKLAGVEDALAKQSLASVAYEEQLIQTYEKIRRDELLVDKAKRAMAVALALLEEQRTYTPRPVHTAEDDVQSLDDAADLLAEEPEGAAPAAGPEEIAPAEAAEEDAAPAAEEDGAVDPEDAPTLLGVEARAGQAAPVTPAAPEETAGRPPAAEVPAAPPAATAAPADAGEGGEAAATAPTTAAPAPGAEVEPQAPPRRDPSTTYRLDTEELEVIADEEEGQEPDTLSSPPLAALEPDTLQADADEPEEEEEDDDDDDGEEGSHDTVITKEPWRIARPREEPLPGEGLLVDADGKNARKD